MEQPARTDRALPVSLVLSEGAGRLRRAGALAAQGALLLVTSSSALAVLLIFVFILRYAARFFQLQGFGGFFTSTAWYPTNPEPSFGVLAIFFGSAIVTLGAAVVAVPLGISAAVCMSDVLPFAVRQYVKPVIEMLAAIPSVVYGFFAFVVLAPLLQTHGGAVLCAGAWLVGVPLAVLASVVLGDLLTGRFGGRSRGAARVVCTALAGAAALYGLGRLGHALLGLQVSSGTNALNGSVILGIMALPTIVSVSEDALYAVGRELREGSYALGATRAETMVKVVIPAARSGIIAAVILGVMRAVGETMAVWMASGHAAQIPSPFYDLLQPVRTLTATIASEMGETAVGDVHYCALFAMGACLLFFSFLCNAVSEWAIRRSKARGL